MNPESTGSGSAHEAPGPSADAGDAIPTGRGTVIRPLRFAEGRLYGVLHRPEDRAPLAAGVLAPPLCHEYQLCHRTLRQAAERCAAAGLAALRFDYRGTGDSAGEAGTALDGWLEDLAAARREATRSVAGVPAFVWGLRWGAAVALAEASGAGGPDFVLAWAPPADGASHLAGLRGAHRAWRSSYERQHGRTAAPDDESRVLGWRLPDGLRADLEAFSWGALTPPAGGVLLAECEDSPLPEAPRRLLAERFADAEWTTVPGPSPWLRDPDVASPPIPAAALESLVRRTVAALGVS